MDIAVVPTRLFSAGDAASVYEKILEMKIKGISEEEGMDKWNGYVSLLSSFGDTVDG